MRAYFGLILMGLGLIICWIYPVGTIAAIIIRVFAIMFFYKQADADLKEFDEKKVKRVFETKSAKRENSILHTSFFVFALLWVSLWVDTENIT